MKQHMLLGGVLLQELERSQSNYGRKAAQEESLFLRQSFGGCGIVVAVIAKHKNVVRLTPKLGEQ
jgi:hypothetical protein